MCHDDPMNVEEPGANSQIVDASRRTFLAEERTFLAWLRSGLAAIAVSLAVGRLLPELLDADQAVYRVLGVGYGLLGIFLLGYGAIRQRAVERGLLAGRFTPLPVWVVVVIGTSGVALAAATVVTLLMGV